MGPTFWQSSERRPRDVGLLFALLIVLLGLRMPTVLFQGRIWAEEGSVFLNNALNMEWRQALLQPEGGYLNLVANVASLIGAHLMPLESVRYVGPIVGIIFQVIPLVVAGTGTITWLRTSAALFALVLIIALSPLHDEVWLNSLHPQFHLALCAVLILAMPPAEGWRKYFHSSIIALAALSGPTAWFLLPLFFARAILDKSTERAKQALLLCVCTAAQVLFFYSNSAPKPQFALGLIAASILAKNLINPTVPYREASWIYNHFASIAQNHETLTSGAVIIALVLVGTILWTNFPRELFWLYSSGVLISIASYASARGGTVWLLMVPYASNRYSFVPHVLFALTVLGAAMTSTGLMRNIAVAVLGPVLN
jgi:hypothetical protein